MSKVFVTGSSGFIGKVLIHTLIQRGYQVSGLVRSKANAELIQELGANAVIGDITQASVLERPVKEADFVLHLAGAYVGESHSLFHSTDYYGVKNLIKSCLMSSIKCLVFASATEVYGDMQGKIATELTPPNPHLAYGHSKLAVEQLLMEEYRNNGLPVVILRIAEVYGANSRLVDGIISAAKGEMPFLWPGSGNVEVSFVHVNDVADAFVLAIEKRPVGQIYNVADDVVTTWNNFLKVFVERLDGKKPLHIPISVALLYAQLQQVKDRLLGRSLLITPDIIRLLVTSKKCSNEKIKQELGFVPLFSTYQEGISEVLRHYST